MKLKQYEIPPHDFNEADMVYGTIVYGPRRGQRIRGGYCNEQCYGDGGFYIVIVEYSNAHVYAVRDVERCDRNAPIADTKIDHYNRALLLACERIADSGQTYEEANTPDGWAGVFLKKAMDELSSNENIS